MPLLNQDVSYLTEAGLTWKLIGQAPHSEFLLIEKLDVSGGGFTPPLTDVLIQIPPMYNQTPLDMWYCDPPIRRNGVYPPQADQIMTLLGRVWQRFSRHIPAGSWRPGKDGVRSLFIFINQELRGKV